MGAAVTTATRVLAHSNLHTNQDGNNKIHGLVPDIQASLVESIAQVTKCMDNNVPNFMHGAVTECMDNNGPKLVLEVDSETNLTVDVDNGPKEGNKEVGLSVSRPNKQLGKWTRINRMEVGLNNLNKPTCMPTLGKRLAEDALFVSGETGEAACSQKRTKVELVDGEIDSTSAGVNDHPCRKR